MLIEDVGRRQDEGRPPQLKPVRRWSQLAPQPEVVEHPHTDANSVFDFLNDCFGSCGFGYAMWGICFSKCSNSAEREDVVTAALLCSCDGLCVWFDDLSSDMNNFFFNLIRPSLGRLTYRAI
jgi:hypothetical protein